MIDVWVAVLGQLLLATAIVARAVRKNRRELEREKKAEKGSRDA